MTLCLSSYYLRRYDLAIRDYDKAISMWVCDVLEGQPRSAEGERGRLLAAVMSTASGRRPPSSFGHFPQIQRADLGEEVQPDELERQGAQI